MKKLASLRRTNISLELLVSDSKETYRNNSKLTPIHSKFIHADTLGYIAFNDKRHPIAILKDFSKTYLSSVEIMKNSEYEVFILAYPQSFEPTITKAFVDYFSKRK
jgi:hypothetical protein